MTPRRYSTCMVLLLVLGVALRFAGLTRGTSDFVVSTRTGQGPATAFYHFHPDEVMILRAALEPVDPLDPAFTVYGLLPVYALRAALHLTMPAHELNRAALDTPASARRAVVTARVLAAVFSCLVLLGTALLGWRYFDPLAACLATLFVALAPGVLQQAHFFIVDGLFALLSLAAVGAVLRATEGQRRARYAVAGLLIGATAAVKLTGLLLGPLLALAHVYPRLAATRGPLLKRLSRPLLDPRLWLAGAVAAVTLAVLEPYLVADPGLILRNETVEDFATSADIARGDVLRPWTLADVHTVPYLHHWTHLFPLIAGWPLTLAFLAGLAHVYWRRTPAHLAALAWVGLYFALVGGLHAKHVRYLVPLVPLLALLAADLLSRLCRLQPVGRWRWAAPLVAAAVAAHTTAYGLAFARIYTVEDSRLQAARWMQDHLPPASPVAVETGGFSLASLIVQESHPLVRLHESRCLGARDYLTCWATQDLLRRQLARADYLVVADANRILQYTAVPELLPVAADFYGRLLTGELGYELVARFENPPRLAGIDFSVDKPDPSFIGYDHPTVYVLQRRSDFDTLWDAWWSRLQADPRCPDRSLVRAVSLLKSGDLQGAAAQAQTTVRHFPTMRIASFVEAYIRMEQGAAGLEQESLERFKAGYDDPSHVAYMIPWASAMSLIGLDLHDLVTSAMVYGHQRMQRQDGQALAVLAIEAANALSECGQAEPATVVYGLAGEAFPSAEIYAALGSAHYDHGDLEASSLAYGKALDLTDGLPMARANLAWNVYLQGNYEEAIRLNRLLLEADARATAAPSPALVYVATVNLALASVAHGDIAAAESLYAWANEQIGLAAMDRLGATGELRDLASRGPNAAAAQRLLDTLWPAAPDGPPSPSAASPDSHPPAQ